MLDSRTTVNISGSHKNSVSSKSAKKPRKAYYNNSQISVWCPISNHPKKFQSLQSLVYHIVRCHTKRNEGEKNELTPEAKKIIKLLNQVSKAVDAGILPRREVYVE